MREKARIFIIIIFLVILQLSFSVETIRCKKCGKLIDKGMYYIIQEKTYCPECYKKYFQLTCSYCGEPIKGKYIIDFWGNKYHLDHQNKVPQCEFCKRFISPIITNGSHTLSDGTIICDICYQTAILELSEAKKIMKEVVHDLKWLGINIETSSVELFLVDKYELAEVGQRKNVTPHHKGMTMHLYHTNNSGEVHNQEFKIYVLKGLPEIHFMEILSHELMHVWQFRYALLENDLDLCEGSCNYVAWMFLNELKKKPEYALDAIKMKEIEYFLQHIENNTDPIYGNGFREVRKLVNRMGVSYWLRYLQKYTSLP